LYHELFGKLRPDTPNMDSGEPERSLETQQNRAKSATQPTASMDDDLFAMGAKWDR
jgi:hypothetical protein